MNISATAIINLAINGRKFELTKDEAEALYTALGRALNKTPLLHYPPGVRNLDVNPNPVFTPVVNPSTPQSPAPLGPPYNITCTAK